MKDENNTAIAMWMSTLAIGDEVILTDKVFMFRARVSGRTPSGMLDVSVLSPRVGQVILRCLTQQDRDDIHVASMGTTR